MRTATSPDTRWSPRKRFDFAAFAPWARDYDAPHEPDLVFGLLRWFVELASRHDVALNRKDPARAKDFAQYSQGTLYGLTHGHQYSGSSSPVCAINPAVWRSSARAIIGRALASAPAWLNEAGAAFGKRKILPVRHQVFGAGHRLAGEAVDIAPRGRDVYALADYVGRRTKLSYNPCHPNACEVCRVLVLVEPRGYSLLANIGIPGDESREHRPVDIYSHSSWSIPPHGRYNGHCGGVVVPPVEGEAFSEFVERAHRTMERILAPSNEMNWFVWTVCRLDDGNQYRGPHPVAERPEAYVLAPTSESAVAFWREQANLPADLPLVGEPVSRDPAALLPPVYAPGSPEATVPGYHDRRCALALRTAVTGLAGFRPHNHDEGQIVRSLLNLACTPYRSTVHRHREQVWRDR